jgi:Protein of unknown function with PCYCGC motif
MVSPTIRLLALTAVMVAAVALSAVAQTVGTDVHQSSYPGNSANKVHAAAQPEKKPTTNYAGPTVLDPSNYYGGAAMGYAAAKAAPQVMSRLFCYCGCDATERHRNLIDCFTSTHGVDCHICQEEAVLGYRLFKDGTALADIQKQIDEKYSAEYPFQEDTANLKQYKASRLYKAAATPSSAASGGAASDSSVAGNGGKTSGAPKVKPGFQVGNCCHDDK